MKLLSDIQDWQEMVNEVVCCDVLAGLARIPDNSVHCIVTSPPYFGLRDYGVDGQIGLEESPEQFIEKMVAVFRECRRVLRPDGTLWMNMGDSYNSGPPGPRAVDRWPKQSRNDHRTPRKVSSGLKLKPKDLMGMPWRVAFALQADGWWLRQDIIWAKPNSMPESAFDRCTKSHEYIFLLTKSAQYFFDFKSIAEPMAHSSILRLAQDVDSQKGSNRVPGKTNGPMKAVGKGNRKTFRGGGVYTKGKSHQNSADNENDSVGNEPNDSGSRRKRSVWTVPTVGYKDAHFATFPPKLIEPCIKAGCPEGGIVLDPFMGTGTTGRVALDHGRKFIGLELNPATCKLADKRLRQKNLF